MLYFEQVPLSNDDKNRHIVRYTTNVSVHRFLSQCQEPDSPILQEFIGLLQNQANTSKAYFFETKGVNLETSQTTTFEFVLVPDDYLYTFADATADPSAFGSLLQCRNNPFGCVFSNLGGDSLLIAPKEQQQLDSSSSSSSRATTTNVYGHLAAFVRRAPPGQVVGVWQLALRTLQTTLQEEHAKTKTVWFSTDGRGVPWLHLRIDPRPKYYSYEPFARFGGSK